MAPRRVVATVCAVVFVDVLGFSLVIPSLPFFVATLGGSGAALGLLLTSYSIAQTVAAPLMGRLSDRVGRRPLILVALAGTTTSLVIAGVATSLVVLVAARIVAGLCGGSIGVANAFLADVTTHDQRARAMSLAGASVGLAFTVGPALGGVLAPLGFPVVCFAGAAIAATNLLAATRVLPRHERPVASTAAPSTRRSRQSGGLHGWSPVACCLCPGWRCTPSCRSRPPSRSWPGLVSTPDRPRSGGCSRSRGAR